MSWRHHCAAHDRQLAHIDRCPPADPRATAADFVNHIAYAVKLTGIDCACEQLTNIRHGDLQSFLSQPLLSQQSQWAADRMPNSRRPRRPGACSHR